MPARRRLWMIGWFVGSLRPARPAAARCGEHGLSLIEVLVALVIASLILGAVLPIASRSMVQNLRLSEFGVRADETAFDELRFRALLASATQRPGRSPAVPEPELAEGGPDGFSFRSVAAQPSPCLQPGQSGAVRVEIERATRGARLVCIGPQGARPLTGWVRSIPALAYSADAQAWHDSWPLEAEGAVQAGSDEPPDPAARGDRVTSAPLVRVMLADGDGARQRRVWIVRIGAVRPLRYDALSLIDGERKEGGPPAPPPELPLP